LDRPQTQSFGRRNAEIKTDSVKQENAADGAVLLIIPLVLVGKGYWGWLAKKMNAPDTKTFELEPVGAFVWSLCDGRHSFDAISRKLRDEYKMNRLEADAALSAFLRTLGQRRLITLTMGKSK
jgi:Coenzyme PQQ synthesis protein D (PqqD)